MPCECSSNCVGSQEATADANKQKSPVKRGGWVMRDPEDRGAGSGNSSTHNDDIAGNASECPENSTLQPPGEVMGSGKQTLPSKLVCIYLLPQSHPSINQTVESAENAQIQKALLFVQPKKNLLCNIAIHHPNQVIPWRFIELDAPTLCALGIFCSVCTAIELLHWSWEANSRSYAWYRCCRGARRRSRRP